jgi:hypothetical protein
MKTNLITAGCMRADFRALARLIADLGRRNDFGGTYRAAVQAWDEAGGFVGYSASQKPLYRRADGRRVLSRHAAVESWL